ncbi:Uncharacterized protein MLTONO_2253 [Mesorhizobium loti]|nr:Uncharacterized protein MLTONO_2253 [Mesorhizobium loti]
MRPTANNLTSAAGMWKLKVKAVAERPAIATDPNSQAETPPSNTPQQSAEKAKPVASRHDFRLED